MKSVFNCSATEHRSHAYSIRDLTRRQKKKKKRTATSCVRPRDSRFESTTWSKPTCVSTDEIRMPNGNSDSSTAESSYHTQQNRPVQFFDTPSSWQWGRQCPVSNAYTLAVAPAHTDTNFTIGGKKRVVVKGCAYVQSVGVLSPYKEFSTQYKPRFRRLPHGPSRIESRCMIFKLLVFQTSWDLDFCSLEGTDKIVTRRNVYIEKGRMKYDV